MSFTTRDLRCTAEAGLLPPAAHYEVSVLYRVSDGPPPCPHLVLRWGSRTNEFGETREAWVEVPCGAPRVPFYATHEMTQAAHAAAVHVFKEFEVDGGVRITSPEGALRYRAHVAGLKGVPVEAIQFNSRGNVKQTVEELKHRAITKRRESGFDERTFAAYKQERNRINAEQNQRGRR